MADLNKQALEMWNAMKPMVDKEINEQTKGTVQRRKAKVTTAPSLVTQKIGVTEPFGDQYFIPFNTNLSTAQVGDVVWVEYMYGATNAFASMYASADTKDSTVGGDLEVLGNATIDGVLDVIQRRCSATLSTSGWYRIMTCADANTSGTAIHFCIGRRTISGATGETHVVDLMIVGNNNEHFANEMGFANVLLIDKIRLTHDGNDKSHVDIHYNSSSEAPVFVDFVVEGNTLTKQTAVSVSFQNVGDSPSGETVAKTYEFVVSTDGANTFTVGAYGQSILGGSYITKNHGVVYGLVRVSIKTATTARTWSTVAVVPSNNRPPLNYECFAMNNTSGETMQARVETGGDVKIWCASSIASGVAVFIPFSYPLKI